MIAAEGRTMGSNGIATEGRTMVSNVIISEELLIDIKRLYNRTKMITFTGNQA